MLEPTLIADIRHIFLHQRPHVSISQATALLGWTRSQMTEAIAAGEVVLMETPLGKWIWREELMAKALEQWPREVIEEALGAEAVLPNAVRLAEWAEEAERRWREIESGAVETIPWEEVRAKLFRRR